MVQNSTSPAQEASMRTKRNFQFLCNSSSNNNSPCYICPPKHGAIAQLVEQRIENPCVPGSNPGSTTKEKKKKRKRESPHASVGLFCCPFVATSCCVRFRVTKKPADPQDRGLSRFLITAPTFPAGQTWNTSPREVIHTPLLNSLFRE